jgi:hypothetical protein
VLPSARPPTLVTRGSLSVPRACPVKQAFYTQNRSVMSAKGIFRQQFTVPLREELNSARFEVIHRACNLDAAGGFKIP